MTNELTKIKLKGSRFSLCRESDGSGDSGSMLHPVDWQTHKTVGETGEIIVGFSVKCGSVYARTMQNQDWWLTTPVKEILSFDEKENICVFITESKSIYVAKGS